MTELIGPAFLVVIVVGFLGWIVWNVEVVRQERIECGARGGMYLENVCVRGERIDLTMAEEPSNG